MLRVLRLFRARWEPEVTPMWFEDSCTRPYNVHSPELTLTCVECIFEVFPSCDIRPLKYGSWFGGIFARVLVDELFGFGAELEVSKEDAAATGEEQL